MQDTCDIFPDIAPPAPLASPPSSMSMSLSLGVFLIISPIRLFPLWVTIVAGLHLVVPRRSRSRSAPFDCPGVPEVLFCGQFDARYRMPMSVCHSLTMLLSYSEVSVFWSLPGLFTNPLNCVDFCVHSLLLTRPLSSNDPGVLGSFCQGQLDVQNRLPLCAFRLLSLLLTQYAVFVCQDPLCCILSMYLSFQYSNCSR